jgi:hypothetical protein
VPFGEPTPEASIASGQGHKKSGTLGHEDIKITGKHYNPGIKSRQEYWKQQSRRPSYEGCFF